jgi:hypothetical protein
MFGQLNLLARWSTSRRHQRFSCVFGRKTRANHQITLPLASVSNHRREPTSDQTVEGSTINKTKRLVSLGLQRH